MERVGKIQGHSEKSLTGEGEGCWKANKNKQENGTLPIQKHSFYKIDNKLCTWGR